VHEFISLFPQGAISYQLSGDSLSWSQVFRKLEENKDRLLIVDYSVSQTTLEQVSINASYNDHAYIIIPCIQVFLNFARKQHVEET